MKKTILLLPFLFFFISSPAQTKRIGLLSHAGNLSSLNMETEGNFGETPEMRAESKKIWDSIFLADSTRLADSLRMKNQKETGTKRADPQPKLPPKSNGEHGGAWLGKLDA